MSSNPGGRPARVKFVHNFRVTEREGQSNKVTLLIDRLTRLKSEYGAGGINSLFQRLLINMSYEEMQAHLGEHPYTYQLGSAAPSHYPVESGAEIQSSEAEEDELDISSFAPR